MGETDALKDTEKLTKLLRFLEQDSLTFGNSKKKVAKKNENPDADPRMPQGVYSDPRMSQRVATFYVNKWPELRLNKDGTFLPSSSGILSSKSRGVIGGTPISLETALELRTIVYGSCVHSFSREWKKSNLAFQNLEGIFPYGLVTQRCGSRALTLCVQGFLIKYLVFEREYKSSIFELNALKPNSFERRRSLTKAICEMLWQAGEKKRCCVCLLQDEACFGPDYRYRVDRITEKLHLFEFKKFEDLQVFLRRNLDQFQSENGHGCILFLYSMVLSRTVQKVWEDLDIAEEEYRVKLLTDVEDCTLGLINLLNTGRAVRHLHNGDMIYNNEGKLLPRPLKGIKQRSEIGFLFWDKGESQDNRTEVGSMLKTPKHPIWVSKVNGQYGLLFSTNIDLVSDWRTEHRFVLHYYTGLLSQEKQTQLTVDTRFNRVCPKTFLAQRREEEKTPPLEQAIMTKWYGANIHWNGIFPFV